REKAGQRRHEDLLREACLPEERISNDDRSWCYAVNRPSEVAKPSGIPNSVIVHRPAIEARALEANRCSHESREWARWARESTGADVVRPGGRAGSKCTSTRW